MVLLLGACTQQPDFGSKPTGYYKRALFYRTLTSEIDKAFPIDQERSYVFSHVRGCRFSSELYNQRTEKAVGFTNHEGLEGDVWFFWSAQGEAQEHVIAVFCYRGRLYAAQ